MNHKSYIDWNSYSDKSLLEQFGEYVRHHRLRQNKTQTEVAKNADISRSTLSLLERGETVTTTTLVKVLRVLNQLSIMDIFRVEQEISPIEVIKAQKKERQRARKSDNQVNEPDSNWEW